MSYEKAVMFFFLLRLVLFVSANDECKKPPGLIFQSSGNISISAIFNVHEGENCTSSLGKGLQEATAAVWAVSLLNQQNYLPGITIGLNIYDACSQLEVAKKTFVQAIAYENCLKNENKLVGILSTPSIRKHLEPLLSALNVSIKNVGPLLDESFQVSMLTTLIREVSFNIVHRVVAETTSFLQEFGKSMAKEGICIYDQVLIDDIHAVNNEVLQPPEETNNTIVTNDEPLFIIVVASSAKISRLMLEINDILKTKTDIFWLIVPTDSYLDVPVDLLPVKTYILSAITPKKENLQDFLNNPEVTLDPLNHREPTKSPLFLNIASKILHVLQPLRQIFTNHCGESNETCPEFDKSLETYSIENKVTDLKGELTEYDIKQVLTVLKSLQVPEMFLFSVSEKTTSDDFAVLQIFNEETSLFKPVLLLIEPERDKRAIVAVGLEDILRRANSPEVIKSERRLRLGSGEKHLCYDPNGNISQSCGICLNFVQYLSKVAQEKQTYFDEVRIIWRLESWVAVNAAIAAIGIICTLAILIFISVRICVGDVLEGNPVLSYFLLLSVMLTYAATIPFSVESSGTVGDLTLSAIVCDLRMFAPPIAYSILFSIIFSRSVMLAASDQDGGFMSHVNGYLLALLIFFASSVQFIMSGEFWLFNSFISKGSASCESMYLNHWFVILHSYDSFLLLLLLAVIPFMARSRRNYKEGTFFTIAIIVIFILWGVWIPLLYLLNDSYNDAIVTFGLTSTATSIVICVFIPRTYLMTTSIVRDRIVNTLPPLTNSNGNFHSESALYDSVNLTSKVGNNNPNFYSINPTDSSPATPQIRPGEYYSSNSEIKIPSPQRLEPQPNNIIRCSTPEHTYEGCDSPFHGPKNVTRF